MATLDEFKKEIPFLVEAGLLAIKQGDEQSAKAIFDAVEILDPQTTLKKMGYGIIAMQKMDTQQAEKYFKQVLEKEPENYRAQAFLGLVYILIVTEGKTTDKKKLMDHLKKGTELAQNVINKSDSPTTKNLAQSVLDWEQQIQEKAAGTGGR